MFLHNIGYFEAWQIHIDSMWILCYRSAAHYYTAKASHSTWPQIIRRDQRIDEGAIRLVDKHSKDAKEKDKRRKSKRLSVNCPWVWVSLYVCMCFQFEMALSELNKINGWSSSCIHPNRPPANFMWFIYGCSRKKWQYHVILYIEFSTILFLPLPRSLPHLLSLGSSRTLRAEPHTINCCVQCRVRHLHKSEAAAAATKPA